MANRLYNKQVSPKGYQKGGRVAKMGGGMMMKRPMMNKGGKTLKPVNPETQKGLSKLPKDVRNKMGYMKKGGRVGLNSGGDVKKKKGKDLSNMKVGDTFHPIVQNVMKKEIVKNFSSKGKSGSSTGDLKKLHKKIKEDTFKRGLKPTEIAKMDKEFNARLKRATKAARDDIKNRPSMRSYRKRQQKAKAMDTGSEN
jgi:hypothetical protein